MILDTHKQIAFKLTPLALALICIGTGSTAFAQESAKTADPSGIEVIEITSTKRVTSLMETGQAVSAFSEESMAQMNIDGSQDLVQYSPSLIISFTD